MLWGVLGKMVSCRLLTTNDNRLLGRKELVFDLTYDDAVPSRAELQRLIASSTKNSEDRVVIQRIDTLFGYGKARLAVHTYEGKSRLDELEPAHLQERLLTKKRAAEKKEQEKEKPAGRPAGRPAEKSAEKPAEKSAEKPAEKKEARAPEKKEEKAEKKEGKEKLAEEKKGGAKEEKKDVSPPEEKQK